MKTICFNTGGFYTLEANRGNDEEKKLELLIEWLRYSTDYHCDIPTILVKCTRTSLSALNGISSGSIPAKLRPTTTSTFFCTLTNPGDDIQSATIQDIMLHAQTHNITSLELDV